MRRFGVLTWNPGPVVGYRETDTSCHYPTILHQGGMHMTESFFAADDIHLSFGGLTVLEGVGFTANEGEILGLIGPNGAGKSSLLNCVTGFYRNQRGTVSYRGQDITHWPPHRVAKIGIGRTFQTEQLCATLSVLENMMIGRHMHMNSSVVEGLVYWGRARSEQIRERERVEEIMDLLDLGHVRHEPVAMLPLGIRKRVDLGRAIVMEPSLVFLDEFSVGMNKDEKEDTVRFILDVYELKGLTIVLVEHDMDIVTDICQRLVVLDFGHKLAEGSTSEVVNNPEVIRAYLGVKRDADETALNSAMGV